MPSKPPTTFGLSVRKSWTSRLLRGRSRSCCSSRPRAIAWLSRVMLFCPSAVTVTTSSRPPTSRLQVGADAPTPARSTTPVRCTFLKPVRLADTVYVPGRRFGISKSPCASVCASRGTLVASSVTTTVAPGTMFCLRVEDGAADGAESRLRWRRRSAPQHGDGDYRNRDAVGRMRSSSCVGSGCPLRLSLHLSVTATNEH